MNTHASQVEAKARPRPAAHPRLPGAQVIAILSACMALQMTSFVIVLPLFARRFSQLGGGPPALAASTLAYALAGTLAAPFMGALADRLGRRRVVLASLAAYGLAFTGYLLANSVPAFIVLRGLAGAFTAGLIPAVTGVVAHLAPAERRAKWIGVVNGGAAVGYVAGPAIGGWLYDRWGYATALVVSIVLAGVTFLAAWLWVPETRWKAERAPRAARAGPTRRPGGLRAALRAFRRTLPPSPTALAVLLGAGFAAMFAYAFVEPSFMFYAYNDLGWTAAMLGLAMGSYGVAFMFGEFGLSHLSDRLGRAPVIAAGLALFAAQFIGLAFTRHFVVIAASFGLAGLGNALFDPAVSAAILDIAPAEHQARALGLKSTAGSLGNVLGPGLAIFVAPRLAARGVFLAAAGLVALSVFLFLAAQSAARSIEPAIDTCPGGL